MGLLHCFQRTFGEYKDANKKIARIDESIIRARAQRVEQERYYLSFREKLNNVSANVDYSKLTFLVVDDFPAFLTMHCKIVERLGAKCVAFESPVEALQSIEESDIGTYDVIVTDINMDPFDGTKLSKKIRDMRRPDTDNMVIIATSAAYPPDVYAAGMNGYIVKPLDPGLMHDILEKYLR